MGLLTGAKGLEPSISGVTGQRDNQLRYAPSRCSVIYQKELELSTTKAVKINKNRKKLAIFYPRGAFAGSIGWPFWKTMSEICDFPVYVSTPAVPISEL